MRNIFTFLFLFLVIDMTGSAQIKQFRSNLYLITQDGSSALMDGTLSLYHNDYSNEVDDLDGRKMFNPKENIAIIRDERVLVIERREDITGPDTIFFRFWNSRVAEYRLELMAKNFGESTVTAVLHDQYANTQTQLNLEETNPYSFSITSDPDSRQQDRFMVVFNSGNDDPTMAFGVMPVTFTNVSAMSKNQNVLVNWNTADEQNVRKYLIERSDDGVHFSETGLTADAQNGLSNYYQLTDQKPAYGVSYYRIKAVDHDGAETLSKAMKVLIVNTIATSTIYPNPTTQSNIQLRLSGHVPGQYNISIYTAYGAKIHTQVEDLTSGSNNIKVMLNRPIQQGIYRLEITGPDGFRNVQNLLLNR